MLQAIETRERDMAHEPAIEDPSHEQYEVRGNPLLF
jgi:hypothetical protein